MWLFFLSVCMLQIGRFYVHCVRAREREVAHQWKTSQHVDDTHLISRQCKWNTRPHGRNEHKQRKAKWREERGMRWDEMRVRDRGGGGSGHHCGIMGESSKLSHHLESYWGSGEEKLQNKHMEAMQEANPQNLVLVSRFLSHYWDLL